MKNRSNCCKKEVIAKNIAGAFKAGALESLKGLSNIQGKIFNVAKESVLGLVREASTTNGETDRRFGDVFRAGTQADSDACMGFVLAVKGISKGILIGVHEMGGDVTQTAGQTVTHAVKEAAEISADVGTVAKRSIAGVIEAAREIGENVEAVARESVKAAIKAAGMIGTGAVESVSDMLIDSVEGFKDVGTVLDPKYAPGHTPESKKTDSESEHFPFY